LAGSCGSPPPTAAHRALPGDDPELKGPFPHILLVLPLPADPPHVLLRLLPHGVAQRPLPVNHAVEIHLGGPAEIDPLSLRLPHDPPNLFASRRAIDGLPWYRREVRARVHPDRRRPAPGQDQLRAAARLGQDPLDRRALVEEVGPDAFSEE